MGDYSWETIFIYVFLCPVLLILYSSFLISVPYYLVLVWLRNIEELFYCDQDVTDKVEWAEHCIKIYNKTEEHLGGYFLFYLTLSQFVWIILFYLGISLTICHGRREMLEGVVCSADLFNGHQKYFYEKPHLDNLSSPDNRCSGDKTAFFPLLVRHRWLQLCQKGCRVAYLGLVITTFFHLSMYT